MELNRRILKNELCIDKDRKPSCKNCKSEIKKACNKRCDYAMTIMHKTAYDVIEEIKQNFLPIMYMEGEAFKIKVSDVLTYLNELQ